MRGANKKDPKSIPNIKIFGASKNIYFGLVFTRNSPLIPMFKKATSRTLENGVYKRISFQWQGDKINTQTAVDTMVLSIGQMFIAFVFMLLFLFMSLFTLCLECIYFKISKK